MVNPTVPAVPSRDGAEYVQQFQNWMIQKVAEYMDEAFEAEDDPTVMSWNERFEDFIFFHSI